MRYNPKGDDDVRPDIEDYPHEKMRQSYNISRYDWDPTKHHGEILRVSKSSLGSFNWCPKQYWFSYFEGLRGETVYYHTRGLNVHDAVEYFWENIDQVYQDILLLMKEDKRESARAMLHDIIPIPPEAYAYGEEEQIRQWVDWQFNRLEHTKGVNWRPVECEANVHAHRYVEVEHEGIPIHMRGFIDTIFANDDGTFSLMELKTGKWKNAGKRKRTQMRKEMQFYKMMVEHSPHHEYLPITHWGWEFPGGGIEGGDGAHIYFEATKDANYTPKSVEKSLARLVEAHLVQEFPATASDFQCAFCDFMEICPKFTGEDLDKKLESVKND